MVDQHDRWCLFCDFELHDAGEGAPQPTLDEYADDLIRLAAAGELRRVFENETRVTRIAEVRRFNLPDGSPALGLLITLGDRRGSNPSFLHFERGTARNATRRAGEVKAASAHCIISLTEDPMSRGRYRMLIEEMNGLGRTPITRMLASAIKMIADDQEATYRNRRTGRRNRVRPTVEVHPRRSREMAGALDNGSFLPVELFDTRPQPTFDENPEFRVRRNSLVVKVIPGPGRQFRDALADLGRAARAEGYDHMRVSWRLPGHHRGGSATIETDLADIGTALFAHRELIHVDHELSDCAPNIDEIFVGAMTAHF